jgi:protein-disulfide isomerase
MKSSMRIILLFALLALSACSTMSPTQPETPMSQLQTGDVIGENEETPETIESLEVVEVPADETGLIPTAPRLSLFTDYTCAYCAEVSRAYVPWILETYVEEGTLSLEIGFLPTGEKGMLSAKTALCAALQEVFSPADKALYDTPLTSTKELTAFAKKIGADAKEISACVQDSEVTAIIGMHSDNAEELGITRVPGFSLGGHTWLGVATREGLKAEIEKAMNE